jgi:hypothetical protein
VSDDFQPRKAIRNSFCGAVSCASLRCATIGVTARAGDLLSDEVWGDDFR